jgi:hypothetical protein
MLIGGGPVTADVIHPCAMATTPVTLPEIGIFEPESLDSGEPLCFARRVEFRNSTPELVIYPDNNGGISRGAAERLSSRYFEFVNAVEVALASLPKLLRAECQNHEIEIDHLLDSELTEHLNWETIKLDPSGTVECYVKNNRVTTNFDIAIGFDEHQKLYSLHFDG